MTPEEKVELDKLPVWGSDFEDPNTVTVKEMEELSNAIFQYAEQIDVCEEQIRQIREKKDEATAQMQQYLQHFGKTNYKSNAGTIEVRTSLSFKTPKTPEDKKAFFEWLQKGGIFWEYASINSRSLDALCKAEYEVAKEENREAIIPGIEKPTEYQKVYLRRK